MKRFISCLLAGVILTSQSPAFAANEKKIWNLNDISTIAAESTTVSNIEIMAKFPNYYVSWASSNNDSKYKVEKSFDGSEWFLVVDGWDNESIVISEGTFYKQVPYYAVRITPDGGSPVVKEYGEAGKKPKKVSFAAGDYDTLPPIYKYGDGKYYQQFPFPDVKTANQQFVYWYKDTASVEFTEAAEVSDSNTVLNAKIESGTTQYTTTVYTENEVSKDYTTIEKNRNGVSGKVARDNIQIPTGFYYDKENINKVDSIFVGSGSILKTYYNRMEYPVYFDGQNSKDVTRSMFKYGTKITPPEIPTKAGMAFDGWYKDKEYKTAWNFETDVLTTPTILYAKWIPEDQAQYYYIIKLIGEDSSGKYQQDLKTIQKKATVNTVVSFDPSSETIKGFKFNQSYDSNKLSGIVTKDSILTLYAYYSRERYQVIFDNNGGKTSSGSNVVFVSYGTTITNSNVPTRDNHTFAGWTRTKDGNDFFDVQSPIVDNMTLYAKWDSVVDSTKATYTTVYYGEKIDDKGEYEEITRTQHIGTIGQKVTADKKKFEGFEFKDTNDNVESVELTSNGATLKLYYKRRTYEFKVDTDGDGSSDRTVDGRYGQRYKDFLPRYDRDNKNKFVGWFTEKEGKGREINERDKLSEDNYYGSIFAYFDGEVTNNNTTSKNDISGTVSYDYKNDDVDDARVTIKQGKKQVDSDKTDKYGDYEITNLNNGYYTIEVYDNTTTSYYTDVINLTSDKTLDIELIKNMSVEIDMSGTSSNVAFANYYSSCERNHSTSSKTTYKADIDETTKLPNVKASINVKDSDVIKVYQVQFKKNSSNVKKADSTCQLIDSDIKSRSDIVVTFVNDSDSYSVNVTSASDGTKFNVTDSGYYIISKKPSTTSDNANTPVTNLGIKVPFDKSKLSTMSDYTSFVSSKWIGSTMSKKFTTGQYPLWMETAAKYVSYSGVYSFNSNTDEMLNDAITRAEMAQVMCNVITKHFNNKNLFNANIDTTVSNNEYSLYTDVKQNDWFNNAISVCSRFGIMNGKGNNKFDPMGILTREEVVQTFMNLDKAFSLNRSGTTTSKSISDFTDTKSVTWSKEALNYGLRYQMISGKGNGRLDPSGKCIRGEIAQMVYNSY